MPNYCAVKNCNSVKSKCQDKTIRFFRFPRDETISNLWIKATGKEQVNVNYERICSIHFTDDDWSLKDKLLNTPFHKRSLAPNSVPSKSLPSMEVTAKFLIETIEQYDIMDHQESEKSPCELPGFDFECTKEFNIMETEKELVALLNEKAELRKRLELWRQEEITNKAISSSEHILRENYNKTCRTCLKNENTVISLTSIFGGFVSIPFEIYKELSTMRLKLTKDDGFPQSICNECVDSLTYVWTFRKLCEQSQKALDQFHKLEELTSFNKSAQKEIEFIDVQYQDDEQGNKDATEGIQMKEEYLDDDIIYSQDEEQNESATEQTFQKQVKRELPNEDITCFNDGELNQTDLIKSETHSEEIQTKTITAHICFRCDQICSTSEELQHHENNICEVLSNPKCRYCDEVFEKVELLDTHMKCAHPVKTRKYICSLCGKEFSTRHSRNLHIDVSHNKNCYAYECDLCNKLFKYKNNVARHKLLCHTFEDHTCPHCSKKFSNSISFNNHMKNHDPNKRHKCKYCNKGFVYRHHLANHERIHTGQKPFLCNTCGKTFRQEYTFTLHIREHAGYAYTRSGQPSGIRQQCELCGKSFHRSALNAHMRTHTGVRPFKCDCCSKSYTHNAALRQHRLFVHRKLKPSPKKTLDLTFENNPVESKTIKECVPVTTNSQDHNEITLGPESTIPETSAVVIAYKCNLCSKEFRLPSSLTKHIKTHSEERKFSCPHCDMCFKRAEHLKIHVNGVHLKRKPYACDYCDKSYARTGDRNNHMKSHTDLKAYTCQYCSKQFRLLSVYKTHLRSHTGEKPYKCQVCNKEFVYYNSIVAHTIAEHGQ